MKKALLISLAFLVFFLTACGTDATTTTTALSIADQVTQTLGPSDTVTESNGAVEVTLYTTATVSLDDGGHANPDV